MKKRYSVDVGAKQVNVFDERFYKIGGEYFPSVTTILEAYPKGYGFYKWLAQKGEELTNQIRDFSAEQGTNVHDACHNLLQGEPVSMGHTDEKNGKYIEDYSLNEWIMINQFVEWWGQAGMTCLFAEQTCYLKTLKVAGTLDLLARDKKGQIGVVDFKTGNKYPANSLQVATYAKCVNELALEIKELAGIEVTWGGILYLGKQTQKGYSLDLIENIDAEFEVFLSLQKVWRHHNPDPRPKNLVYPETIVFTDGKAPEKVSEKGNKPQGIVDQATGQNDSSRMEILKEIKKELADPGFDFLNKEETIEDEELLKTSELPA